MHRRDLSLYCLALMIINRAIRQMFGFIYEPGATLGRQIVGENECTASATRKKA